MSRTQGFRPDWASPPGDTIVDILQQYSLTETEFAKKIGKTLKDTKDLLQGRTTITIAVARKLEIVLGASVEFWMSRDYQYRQDIARLHEVDEEWLGELPVNDMIKFGWLSPTPKPSDEMAACLHFFQMPNVNAWREAYSRLQQMAAFRTSPSLDSRPAAVAVWLRQGEIEAETIDCRPWDAKQFQDTLSHLRTLTREKDPSRFFPELQKCCADCGVAVAIVRSPSGCRASGATRFLTHNKALLQLSFRHLSDDHFWFTFFHEAGHLLLHGEKGFFLEGTDAPSTTEEKEANKFAADTLVPTEFQPMLFGLRADARKIIRFAMQIGVSPGIVVGQLQHAGKIKYGQMNSLKRRFKWEA